MPWVRNEMKRNGMEWNGTERRWQAAQHLSLQPAQLFALAPHIRFLFSPTLSLSHSHSPSSFSWAALLCLWEATAAICERGLCPHKKKKVTNKKRVKIKKKNYSSKKIAQPSEAGASLEWERRGMWTLFFVLCLVQMFALFASFVIYYYFLASAFKQIA